MTMYAFKCAAILYDPRSVLQFVMFGKAKQDFKVHELNTFAMIVDRAN